VTLPLRAKAVIGVAGAAGLITLAVAGDTLARKPLPDAGALAIVGAFTTLVAISWLWPLVMFRDTESEAIHLDEGFFVVMALLIPASQTIVAFAVATAVAQLVRRRPAVKSVFNFGQVLTSVGLGLLVSRALAAPTANLTLAQLGAAMAGAAVYFVVNSCSVAAIVAAIGTPWRKAVLDGLEIRVLVVGACVAIGMMTALAISAYQWSLPLAVLPLLILRQVLAGHFQARHDRTRLHGLFEATLEANRSLGDGDAIASILESARSLLRCPDASLTLVEPASGQLGAPLRVNGEARWLVVSGRGRNEPFDAADEALLMALAAVGAGALTNEVLYHEGRYQRERLSAITSSLGEGVCAVDRAGQLTFQNPAAERILGWPATSDSVRAREAGHGGGHPAPGFLLAPALRAMQSENTVLDDDTKFQRQDGTWVPVAFTASAILDGSQAVGAVIAFRDITERKAFEEELSRHAFHDVLTGLANRRLFLDHLDRALDRTSRTNEVHAVLFFDVDRFKVVNDSLGHHAGDQLLKVIGDRMRAAVRPSDMLARFGGDEFTLLLEGVTGPDEAVGAVRRIRDQLRTPIELVDGHQVVATLSVGIALTGEGKTRDDVLHDADVAMYQAKAKGRSGHYEIFDVAAMGARSADLVELEVAMRKGLERDEFEVYYQPLFNIGDQRVVGAEALVRWNHPERGLLGPAEFIRLAEDTGLILPLGRAVLQAACGRAKTWADRFGTLLSMSVNLSGRQLQQPGLADEVAHIMREAGVDPQRMCLEITESLAMEDVEHSRGVMKRLKELGVRLAIDDFGTGYSSLSYLKRFPIDIVKIDRSFVDGLDMNRVDSAIVAAVIGLAKAVNMTTVAEGVETSSQLAHLRSLGCPVVQGYYLARPMTATAIDQLLEEQFGSNSIDEPAAGRRRLLAVPS
jgi:diguanylate cyclase (GGDEF)-like protein/PAS domain S-box-containing protein